MYKVWRNGALIAIAKDEQEANEVIDTHKAFDTKHGPAWGYSVGRYHKTKGRR